MRLNCPPTFWCPDTAQRPAKGLSHMQLARSREQGAKRDKCAMRSLRHMQAWACHPTSVLELAGCPCECMTWPMILCQVSVSRGDRLRLHLHQQLQGSDAGVLRHAHGLAADDDA